MTKQDDIKKQYEPIRGPVWIVEFKLPIAEFGTENANGRIYPEAILKRNEKIKDNTKDKDGSH